MDIFTFDRLIGNTTNINLLRRAITHNTFSQFTIFSGILGTGKSTSAQITAMGLTCEKPIDGSPCCKCQTCRSNMKAFQSTGESFCVKIINVGKLSKTDEVKDVIHEIFELEGGSQRKVFILEEAHALASLSDSQTALLSEIDRIPPNVFIIMCTTKIQSLIEELQSRAIIYTFGRLTDSEAAALAEKIAQERGYSLDSEIFSLILKSSKGIPRSIIKMIDMAIDNEMTVEEMRDFLQTVSDSQWIRLFESMQSEDIDLFQQYYSEITEKVNPSDALASLKSFMVQVAFLVEGGISGSFFKPECNIIKTIFTKEVFNKVIALLDNTSYRISVESFQLLLFRIRMVVQSRSLSEIVKDSKRVAMLERTKTARMSEDMKEIASSGQGAQLTRLSVDKLQAFTV